MTFQFTSGPAYVLTFIALFAYAIISHATFEAYALWAVSLFGLHAGKRLWQKLKDPRIELGMGQLECEDTPEEPKA
jgi:hypothetical protein